ncbi:cyclin-dependent kinase 2-like [Diaphorina citri]|uniref:cyclin-dependent kinase n=1 Tax=Diaphorina citri TaxID=121845 RepID=A0A3Q0J5B0_DIACI|nr:cyclin-dependent kinase 2-like [Diaphorina citri]
MDILTMLRSMRVDSRQVECFVDSKSVPGTFTRIEPKTALWINYLWASWLLNSLNTLYIPWITQKQRYTDNVEIHESMINDHDDGNDNDDHNNDDSRYKISRCSNRFKVQCHSNDLGIKHFDTPTRSRVQVEGVPSTALREISVLKELKHPNVIRLHDVIPVDFKLFLVFEFLRQDLKDFLQTTPVPVPPALAKSYLYQLLEALRYCHSRRIIHRDLKPQNILINKSGALKLADFGLSRAFTIPMNRYTHEVVTLWYRPPEILLGAKVYSTTVDIWSAGCIFSEMITKKTLFAGDSEIDQLFRIFRTLGTPHEDVWPGVSKLPIYKTDFPEWRPKKFSEILNLPDPLAVDVFSKIMALDPKQRVSAKTILQHEYFNQVEMVKPTLGKTPIKTGGKEDFNIFSDRK